MDSALKQNAIVAEVTQGTTPATPVFLLLRDSRISGAPQRSNNRSPERRSDRRASNMYSGLTTYAKAIEMPWARDAASDLLFESLLNGTFATDVLKDGSTKRFFTLEEKYEGGGTDPYRRLEGCMVDSLNLSWRLGGPGALTFNILALSESTDTAIIAGATYTAPTPYADPVTSVDITVTDLFSIASPRLMELNLAITNNNRNQYAFGSPDPFGIGLGNFDVAGSCRLYFSQLSDYATFVTRQTGLDLDLTIGSVTNQKDRLQIHNVDVWNPDVDDPGQTGDHMVTLNFLGRFDALATSVLTLTRNVA